MRRAMGLIAAGGIMALLTAACGDDRPSREALTERVTEICEAAGERHEQAASGFDFEAFDPETSDLAKIVPLVEQNVAIGRETANELDKVRGPEADEDTIDRWIDVNNKIADNADDMIAAARDGDRGQFMSLGAAEEELHAEFPDDPMFEGC
jgi:hypothetical protein